MSGQGDLARAIVHEPNDEWPDRIEIVAYWGKRNKSVTLSSDQFFGRNGHNAPLSGDMLVLLIDRLRRNPPKK